MSAPPHRRWQTLWVLLGTQVQDADESLQGKPPPPRRCDRSSHRDKRRAWAMWLALALLVFTAGLGRNTRLSSHEERVTLTATTMAKSGWPWNAARVEVPQVEAAASVDGTHFRASADGATWSVNPWLVPVFDGTIRLQKPPLPYWTTATLFRLFGETPDVARLAPALLGIAFCVLISRLARLLLGGRAAMIALALSVSSYFMIDEFRKAMADPYLACLTLGAIVCWISASTRARGKALRVVGFYALLALAGLAKGPVALLHVGVALTIYSIVHKRRPRVAILFHAIGGLLFLAIALPWPIYILKALPTAIQIWRFESVGEFADNQRNARPIWFYLPNLLLIGVPWSFMWLTSGINFWQRRTRRRAFAWIWIAVIVAIFSCSHMKKNAYLLPLMPAMMLAMTQAVSRFLALARRRPREPAIGWAATGHWIGGVAFAVMIGVASLKSLPTPTAIVVCLASTSAALVPLRSLLARDFARWFQRQAVAFALLVFLFLAFPESAHRTKKRSTADDDSASAPSTLLIASR